MKKTISINIAGIPFVIDEDAYELLRNYIDTLREAFRNTDDCREILTDIEARISELLSDMTSSGVSTIVTLSDVENVISRIGKPEDMIEFEEDSTVTVKATEGSAETEEIINDEEKKEKTVPPPYIPPVHIDKKLYRDPRNSMLGGVCSGLGWFFNIDATWVRLIAVAIAFLASVADYDTIYISLPAVVCLYVILWIVLPQANTPYERMQMMGESASISDIGKTVTDTFRKDNPDNNMASPSSHNKKNGDEDQDSAHREESAIPQMENTPRKAGFADTMAGIFGGFAKVMLVILLFLAVPLFIAICIGIIGCIFSLLLFGSQWGISLWADHGPVSMPDPFMPICCGLSYLVFIGVPVFMLIKVTLLKKHNMGRPLKIALLILWIASFVAAPLTTAMLIDSTDLDNDYCEYFMYPEDTDTSITTDRIHQLRHTQLTVTT